MYKFTWPSIGVHKKLKFFSLKGCKNLKTVPRKFEIESLDILIFSICLKVKRIPKFGENKEGVSKLLLDDVRGPRTKEELAKEWFACQFKELKKPWGFYKTRGWELKHGAFDVLWRTTMGTKDVREASWKRYFLPPYWMPYTNHICCINVEMTPKQ